MVPHMMRTPKLTRLLMVVAGLSCFAMTVPAQNAVEANARSSSDGSNARSGIALSTQASSNPPVFSQYTLGPADLIHVNVWKSTELSQTVTVDPDGFVSLPLLGDVRVAGLTANELARNITLKLSSYVVNAQVTVSIVEIRSRRVFVTGQIGKPGAYPLTAPVTVLQLIAQAGGLNTYANRKRILVLRGSKDNLIKIKFNYISAIHGDATQDIALQPGDTVIIP